MEGERAPLHEQDDSRLIYGTLDGGRLHSPRKLWISLKIFFACALVLCIALVVTLYFEYKVPAGEHPHASTSTSVKKMLTDRGRGSSRTTQKHMISSDILDSLPIDVRAALNPAVDPCEDFYEFSCGGWEKITTIPTWQSSWAKQWDGVNTAVEQMTTKALEADEGPAGRFYRACMDTDTIQTLGAAPLKPWLQQVEMVKDYASLMKALAQMAIADISVFFSWWIDADSVDSSVNSFFIAQGGITMPDQSYYTSGTAEMQKHRDSYTELIVTIMQLSGSSPEDAKADAANVLEVETAIARIMTSNADERNEHGKRAMVEDLAKLLPSMDWSGWFGMIGVPQVGSDKGYLIIKNEAFLKGLDTILTGTELDKIKSYLRWQAVYSYAPFLTFKFEDALLRYNEDLYGISHLPPRWRKCFFSTGGAMDMTVSKLFVDRYFPESSRRAAIAMLEQIRDRFNATLQTKDWMDPPTRERAVRKLEAMFLEVGHPTVWPPSATETFEAYGGIHEHAYFDNCVATNAYDVHKTLARLGTPVDRRRWGSSSATDVNSYYSRKVNGIFIPAGILQPPFYSPAQAAARNYGSVGAICGHEMTHGFDDVGREYDAEGNRKDWWTPGVVSNFKSRAACIASLFSSYELFGRRVNGKLTLGEAIADRGGLEFAWEAFVEAHRPSAEARRLFFIAMGQTWCEKQDPKGARAALLTDQHPPARFRVIGTLSQFPPFAETFNCPAGSAMNPTHRCELW